MTKRMGIYIVAIAALSLGVGYFSGRRLERRSLLPYICSGDGSGHTANPFGFANYSRTLGLYDKDGKLLCQAREGYVAYIEEKRGR